MHRSRQSVARLLALGTITLAACQDATLPPTAPSLPQAPSAARSPQAQARLEAIFRSTSPEVMALPGTVFADNDEAVGKVVFGVENANAIGGVRQALRRLGIDEADYDVIVTEPIVMAASLRDAHRPTLGGVQIHFSRYLCTLGFNATALQDNNERSFITNSHCTATQGGVENTQYYQPTSSNGSAIATEVEDPVYVKGGSDCPRGKKCRHADVSRAAYAAGTASTLGSIARTTGFNNGNLDVVGAFSITSAENGTKEFTIGRWVNKVGRTTGWTRGTVSRSCVDTGVSGSTVVLLCQAWVTSNTTIVGGGDSGSAVFGEPSGNAVALLGILWGGSSDGRTFIFSPLKSIEQEIGQLDVVSN